MSQQGSTHEGGTGGGGITEIDADTGSAMPVAGVINIFGGTGITTSASGNTITITATGSGFTWNVVTSASNPVTLVSENGYIPKGATPVQFALPAAATVGDTYKILGYGNLWTISQNANQTISLGIQTTTAGATGSITAAAIKDSIEMICVTANLEFVIADSVGNLTFA
jgi:hypothetical protein